MKIQTDISYIKDSVKQNAVEHREIIDKIDGFIESSDNRFAAKKEHQDTVKQIVDLSNSLDGRFAPKMAWTVLVWIGGIIGAAIIIGVIGVIVNSFLYINQ